jgi:hypothetical protein
VLRDNNSPQSSSQLRIVFDAEKLAVPTNDPQYRFTLWNGTCVKQDNTDMFPLNCLPLSGLRVVLKNPLPFRVINSFSLRMLL